MSTGFFFRGSNDSSFATRWRFVRFGGMEFAPKVRLKKKNKAKQHKTRVKQKKPWEGKFSTKGRKYIKKRTWKRL